MNGSQWLETLYPRLNSGEYRITSPESELYNCVAWALKEQDRLWWPEPTDGYFWPQNIPVEETLETFLMLFLSLGFETCQGVQQEEGYEKIAIYVDEDGIPNHTARQLPSGKWTSKLGDLEDIEHELEGLTGSGSAYGVVEIVVKRRVENLS